jgi:hypothetical protein
LYPITSDFITADPGLARTLPCAVGVTSLISFALLIALALAFCGTSYVLRRRRERHEDGEHAS